MRDLLTDKNKKQAGMGVLEVIISLMVITSTVSAVILIVFGNQTIKLDNEVNNVALYQTSGIIEKSKILADLDFNSVVSSSSFPVAGTENIFYKDLLVNNISPCRKDIVGSVSWSVQENRPQNVYLSTSLVSAEEAAAMGNDCILTASTVKWRNPQTYNGIDLYPGGNAGTDLDTIPINERRYILLTSVHSASTSHDFWIYDVTGLKKTDVLGPLSSLDTGYGLYGVDAAKNEASGKYYAYVVGKLSPTDPNQLKVIDVTDMSDPEIVAQAVLPGVGNSYPEGREVYFYNDKLYIGTWETAGNEFHIFDVSDPLNPVSLGSRQMNHSVKDIYVRKEKAGGIDRIVAYVAVSVSSSTYPELVVLDATNPASINQIGSFNAPGIQNGTALYVLGKTLYLGREAGPSDHLYILDISNLSSITSLGSAFMDLGPSTASINSIIVSGDLAFLGTEDSNQEFQVWNVENPSNIYWWSEFNFPAGIMGMDFDGSFIYTSVNSNDGLRILYDAP